MGGIITAGAQWCQVLYEAKSSVGFWGFRMQKGIDQEFRKTHLLCGLDALGVASPQVLVFLTKFLPGTVGTKLNEACYQPAKLADRVLAPGAGAAEPGVTNGRQN